MLYIGIMNERMTLSFYKNMFLFLSKGVKSLWCERDRQRQREREREEDRLPYWPLMFFSHSVGRYPSQAPSHSLALSVTDRISSGRKLRLNQDSPYLTWAFSYNNSQQPYISVQLCDCFCLFTHLHPVQRNLWLTARSRVNMQQEKRIM